MHIMPLWDAIVYCFVYPESIRLLSLSCLVFTLGLKKLHVVPVLLAKKIRGGGVLFIFSNFFSAHSDAILSFYALAYPMSAVTPSLCKSCHIFVQTRCV